MERPGALAGDIRPGRRADRGNDTVLNLDLVFLAVWRHESGVWRLLAWQSTNRPKPATA